MDAIGMDFLLSDRAYEEAVRERNAPPENEGAQEDSVSNKSPPPETQSSSETTQSYYQTSSSLATATTVPVSDHPHDRDARWSKHSTSSTSSSSSTDSRTTAGASLYIPEYLTPSISYERQTPDQLLVALIGRAFDQPEKIASLLQEQVRNLIDSDTPVAKFTPFTVKRKALCRGNFDSRELKKHDLICMCYNASEARILLTGHDGYYSTLLKQIEIMMGPNKVAFLVSNYSPPSHHPHPHPHIHSDSDSDLTAHPDTQVLSPTLKTRLSLQPALSAYLDQGQVFSWTDKPSARHSERLLEVARQEPNPQGILSVCCVM